MHQKGSGELFPGIPEIISQEYTAEQGDALLEQIKAFIHCITEQQEPLVSGEDGKHALATAMHITDLVNRQFETDSTSATQAS
jgi:predicted dehydrogenase